MLRSPSFTSSTNGNSLLFLAHSPRGTRGFATLLLISLMPLLLALILGFWGLCQLVSLRQSFDDICRNSILSIQKQNSLPLHQLMKLNPLAESLIRQKKKAYKRLAIGLASKNPLIITKAKVKIIELSSRQMQLAQSQQLLKMRARSMSLDMIYSFQRIFLNKLAEKTKFHRAFLNMHVEKLRLPTHRWSVRATAPAELASPYEHLPFFAKAQTMSAHWKMAITPRMLLLLGGNSKIEMEGKCQATLLKEKKYPAVLVEDKFF